MSDSEWLAERFEEQRPRLRSVVYRLTRAGTDEVDTMGGVLDWER